MLPFVLRCDQGSTNTCVLFATCQALRCFLKLRGNSNDLWFSVRFGYYNTLLKQGEGIVDNGCWPRVALQTLQSTGFCREDHWPWDESAVLAHPLPDAYTFANDQKLKTTYYRLLSTGDNLVFQVKQALSKGYPIIWGGPIDAAYENYYSNGGAGLLQTPVGPFVGSHMRCLVGYTADYAIEANSWGTAGLNGLGHVDWNFIRSAPDVGYELWVFDSVPTVSG